MVVADKAGHFYRGTMSTLRNGRAGYMESRLPEADYSSAQPRRPHSCSQTDNHLCCRMMRWTNSHLRDNPETSTSVPIQPAYTYPGLSVYRKVQCSTSLILVRLCLLR